MAFKKLDFNRIFLWDCLVKVLALARKRQGINPKADFVCDRGRYVSILDWWVNSPKSSHLLLHVWRFP
jgi:hypothetical protein